MNSFSEKLRAWLINISGKKLAGILALIYVYDNQQDEDHPQGIYFKFNTNSWVLIECASDGESINFKTKEPDEVNLDEYGKEILKDISGQSPWNNCIGKKLRGGSLIMTDDNICLGIRLLFSSKISVDIVNLGDEMYIFNLLPDSITQDENIYIMTV